MSYDKLMIKAAKTGNLEAVKQLLAADPSLLHARDTDESTPLHCAAWKGHPEVASFLLDQGADVNAINKNDHYGTTALHAAAHGNQKQVAEILIARGADLNALNLAGRTPLEETTVHNATAVRKLLA